MIPKQGRGTARSTPWAPPPAYNKKKSGDTFGRVDGYDGLRHKPDVLPRIRKEMERWRFATWNVGSMTGRGRELAEEMGRRSIDVMCVQETKWGGNAAKELGGGYKIFYSGESNKRNGVGIIISQRWKDNVVEVKRVSDRLTVIKLKGGRGIVMIISAYGTQVGCTEEEKEAFLDDLENMVGEVTESKVLVIAGDLNGHVGKDCGGYDRVHGGHGYGERNEEGEKILDMAQRKELVVCSTRYRKRDEHLITYSSGGKTSQLDYILVKQSEVKNLKDCKVIPGSEIVSQHRLVVLDMWNNKEHKRKVRKVGRFMTWKLKRVEIKSKFRDVVEKMNVARVKEGEVEEMWQELKQTLRKASEEVLGRTKSGRKKQRESWWWNEDVRQVLKQKKLAFKKWQKSMFEGDKEEYRIKNGEAKKIVAIVRKQSTQ